jgi:Icc-related predicted phosphoesterase
MKDAQDYRTQLGSLLQFSGPRTILMTHIPALGYVDLYKENHEGSQLVLDHILQTYPLLHLTGHVHDALGKAWINGSTLSINPGGGLLHDQPGGVKLTLVEIEDF